MEAYENFQRRAEATKDALLEFLLQAKRKGLRVLGYGAAAKGNTLINYAGITSELLSQVSDSAPSKQGHFLPGSHIPIVSPESIKKIQPEYVLILPWNLAEEIRNQLKYIRKWGGQFVSAIPKLKIN